MHYESQDYLIHGLLYLAALAQLIPAYFGWSVLRLDGYAKYWTESGILFVGVMLWIGVRRVVVAVGFDPSCPIAPGWLFDQVISTFISSAAFTAIAVLKYKFFALWLDKTNMETPGGEKP